MVKISSYLFYSENCRPLLFGSREAIKDFFETSKPVPPPALSDVSIKFYKMFIWVINSFCLSVELVAYLNLLLKFEHILIFKIMGSSAKHMNFQISVRLCCFTGS